MSDSNPALLSFLLLFPSLISSRLDSSYALSLEPAGKPISVPVMQIVWCLRSFHSWFTYKVHRRSAAAGREAGCPFFFLVLREGTGGDSGVTASIEGVDVYVGGRPVSIVPRVCATVSATECDQSNRYYHEGVDHPPSKNLYSSCIAAQE